jgi:ribosome maturation factor RimP
LVTLEISAGNDILVEIDRLAGVDVDFCADLNRVIVESIKSKVESGEWQDIDYSLEVGSVSLTDPFKTKMQFEKNLGHNVEVMVSTKGQSTKDQVTKGQSTKYKGQLVSVDEDTFSVDIEEKVKVVESQKSKVKRQIVTHTWRYDEPKYVKYDLKF